MKTVLSWSSGKDSAWTLHVLREQGIEVSLLLTTVNEAFGRVAMHAVRRELLDAQAEVAGVPLMVIDLPWPCSNEVYESKMSVATKQLVASGYDTIAFGDLFLPDIREYREKQLEGSGLTPIFPLWEIPTKQLADEMLRGGLKARISCVDPGKLKAEIAGCEWDTALLEELPRHIDPCGENGEFHTFAYDGPMFRTPLVIRGGEVVERDGFVFADLLQERAAELQATAG
jgi:uncharacterized protein (TIGR00290 family)